MMIRRPDDTPDVPPTGHRPKISRLVRDNFLMYDVRTDFPEGSVRPMHENGLIPGRICADARQILPSNMWETDCDWGIIVQTLYLPVAMQ